MHIEHCQWDLDANYLVWSDALALWLNGDMKNNLTYKNNGPMLSVIIEADHKHDALARTLTSLVAGAIDGIIREVIVCDPERDEQTQLIADHMGCVYLGGADISEGIAHSKNEWLLFLQPGARLVEGWDEATLLHMQREQSAARFSLSRHDRPPFWGRFLRQKNQLESGLLVSRQRVIDKTHTSILDIARHIGRPKILNAQIIPAPR